MMFTRILSAPLALLLLLPGGAAAALHDDIPAQAQSAPVELHDEPLSEARLELLDTAFTAASAFPAVPHLRDRSRAQQSVAAAAMELGQFRRVLDWAPRIEGWQRGQVYADLALQLAGRDEAPDVEEYLALAEQIARKAAADGAQEWSVDRVRARIAATHLRLGQTERAREIGAHLEHSEQGVIESEHAALGDETACELHLLLLDELFARGGFDQLRNGLDAGVRFSRRFHANEELRERLEAKLKEVSVKLPPMIRIRMLGDLAAAALVNTDRSTALRLVDEAVAILDATRWGAEHRIPLMAELASLRWQAGDRKGALASVESAVALYGSERERIVDIDRAGALRPLAEACQAMSQTALAVELYRRALEEGVANPNSRPRANDLVATCISLAQHGPEPDDELRERITEVAAELGAPW